MNNVMVLENVTVKGSEVRYGIRLNNAGKCNIEIYKADKTVIIFPIGFTSNKVNKACGFDTFKELYAGSTIPMNKIVSFVHFDDTDEVSSVDLGPVTVYFASIRTTDKLDDVSAILKYTPQPLFNVTELLKVDNEKN